MHKNNSEHRIASRLQGPASHRTASNEGMAFKPSRRAFVQTLGAAGLLSAAFPPVRADTFSLPSTPSQRVQGLMRLSAGIGQTSVFTNQGIMYGRVPGALLRPLFGFITVLEIRCEVLGDDRFSTVQKEAMICIDPQTRDPLKEWRNPYTGQMTVPLGYVSPDNRYYFSPEGSYMRSVLPDDLTQRRKAQAAAPQQSWHCSRDDIWVTERRYNRFPSALTKEEFPEAFAGEVRESVDILTYRGKLSDFRDTQKPSIPSAITMMADTPWPLWMGMGKRPGGTIWHGFGSKYTKLSNISQSIRIPIEKAYPGFLKDPWNFPSKEYGTAAQMRKLRAQGRL